MNRRQALQGLTAVMLACLPAYALAASAVPADLPLLQGTADGRILESLDGGQTWTTVAKLGGSPSVESLEVVGDRVFARVRYGGYPFVLSSQDARKWYSEPQ